MYSSFQVHLHGKIHGCELLRLQCTLLFKYTFTNSFLLCGGYIVTMYSSFQIRLHRNRQDLSYNVLFFSNTPSQDIRLIYLKYLIIKERVLIGSSLNNYKYHNSTYPPEQLPNINYTYCTREISLKVNL